LIPPFLVANYYSSMQTFELSEEIENYLPDELIRRIPSYDLHIERKM
jgi:hypothetical protein